MWPIANMVWRIGEIVDVHEQIAWTRDHGFTGVAFHACAGSAGAWQGVEPAECTGAARAAMRDEIAGFELREIHAPFAIKLPAGAEALRGILDFAGDVGAGVVTVHADLPPAAAWLDVMGPLNDAAAERGLVIGLEVLDHFDELHACGLPNIGVTLDLGHLCAADDGRHLRRLGTVGDAVRQVGDRLFHLHVHDWDGGVDHIEVGTGRIDFDDALAALKDIGYARGMCLEMNPGRVGPEGILRSRRALEEMMRAIAAA